MLTLTAWTAYQVSAVYLSISIYPLRSTSVPRKPLQELEFLNFSPALPRLGEIDSGNSLIQF